MDVGEQVVLKLGAFSRVEELLNLTDEAPDGQIIVEHLRSPYKMSCANKAGL